MRKIKRKILFGITSLTIGGAERVLVDIANKLCEIYDITIFSIYDNGELKKELNSKIKFEALYKKRYDELSKREKKWIPIKILLFSKWIYNKYINKNYDVEIAFLEGPITRLFSNKNENSKKISWIHTDIESVFNSSFKSKLKKYIDKKIYKKYNDLVFVSEDNMQKFQNIYNDLNTENMHVIYNYINKDLVIKKSEHNINIEFRDEDINLLTVCRLVKAKAIDRFIKVHKRLIEQGLKHKVYIIGDGPEKANLANLIKQNGVENTFILLGKKENPYPYIKKADYFCLLSEVEGYGMVLEEAKILNKKIIVTNTAARECVENYPNVLILENSEDEIYDGLYKLLKGGNDENIFNNYLIDVKYDNDNRLQEIIDLVGD